MDQKKVGVLLSYGQTVISTIISLVYTPVMLRLLGQSEYGLYTLVNGFISNLALLSFGLGSAYVRYYSRAQVKDGEEGVSRINGMFMVIFLCISLLSLFVGGIMVASCEEFADKRSLLLGINRARLYRNVCPGETVKTYSHIANIRRDKFIITYANKAYVGAELVAETEVAIAMR